MPVQDNDADSVPRRISLGLDWGLLHRHKTERLSAQLKVEDAATQNERLTRIDVRREKTFIPLCSEICLNRDAPSSSDTRDSKRLYCMSTVSPSNVASCYFLNELRCQQFNTLMLVVCSCDSEPANFVLQSRTLKSQPFRSSRLACDPSRSGFQSPDDDSTFRLSKARV
jgi:hypothetical protein